MSIADRAPPLIPLAAPMKEIARNLDFPASC
jgi:hypothetical protein